MRKLFFPIVLSIFCWIIFYACNTKEIRLITNVEYTMDTAHQEEGYVKDPLETSVVVTPQKVLPEFEYGIQYEIISGEGYFIAADSTIIAADEGIILEEENEFSITWNYVGTVSGDHKVAIKTYDNFEKSKTETLVYAIKDVEILWQAVAVMNTAKVGDTIPVNLELQNQTQGREVSFEYHPKITVGRGTFLNEAKAVLEFEDFSDLAQGTTLLYFIPSTTGSTLLSFDLRDSNGQEKTTTLELSIVEDVVNIPPIAVAAIKDGGPNKGAAPFTVIFDNSNSIDTDDGIVSYVWDFGMAGSTSIAPNPSFTFETPGEYTVTLTVTDASGEIHQDTLLIIVEAVIDANFSAVADTASTTDDTPINIAVLDNDQIAVGITAVVETVSTPLNGGTAVIESDGSITFTPKSGLAVNDSFTYTITNTLGGSSQAQVTIQVTLSNQPPVASDDVISTPENTTTTIEVLAGDQDPEGGILTLVSTAAPQEGGTVVINDDQSVSYTPATDFIGTDSFSYVIRDDAGNESSATVTVTVTEVDQNPIAIDDTISTEYLTPVVIPVLDNDSDPEASVLSILSVGTPNQGIAVIEDNTILYTPNGGFEGTDSFSYTIQDEAGNTAEATIAVTVVPRETITIADANFEQYLIDNNLDSDGLLNNTMYLEDAAVVEELNLDGLGITSLVGIEFFTALKKLLAPRNSISEIDLSTNTALTALDLSDSELTSIDLSTNIALNTLGLSDNNLSSIDLNTNTALSLLWLNNNQFETIDISNLSNLGLFQAKGNNLVAMDLSNNANLNTLDLTSNSALECILVADQDAASANSTWQKDDTAYYSEGCDATRIVITDTVFEGYLVTQGLDTDGIVNGGMFLVDAQKVTEMTLGTPSQNPKNLVGIEYFVNLESLSLNFVTLDFVDLSNNTKLTSFSASNTQLAGLDLSKNINLEHFDLSRFSFETETPIDLSNAPNLITLSITTVNRISALNIQNGNNDKITDLGATLGGCIQVDSFANATNNTGWIIDAASYYSVDCTAPPKDTIPIEDPVFEVYLIASDLDTDGMVNGKMYQEDAENITNLTLGSPSQGLSGLNTLNGIEYFINLETLTFGYFSKDDLDLSKTTQIKTLNWGYGSTNTLDLSQHAQLEELSLVNFGITGSATLDLSANTKLEKLSITGGTAITIPNINIQNGANTLLTTLTIGATTRDLCIQVDNYAAALKNTSWTIQSNQYYTVNCSKGPMAAIPDQNFEQALIDRNVDTDPIINGGIYLTDAQSVSVLSVDNQAIQSLEGLAAFESLSTLVANNNALQTVDLSQNAQISTLILSGNLLTSLDISTLTNLSTLDLSNNPSLSCVQVADYNDGYRRNSWIKDDNTYYSEDCSGPRESVDIPDGNFEQFLIDTGHDSYSIINGVIGVADAEGIMDLSIIVSISPNVKNIVSIEGIEHFKNLENLYFGQHTLDHVDLSSNINLKSLSWRMGKTKSLNLSNNHNLHILNLQYFTLTENFSIDLSHANDLQIVNLENVASLTKINLQNGNNSAITSLSVSSPICIQVDNVLDALNNENWNINNNASYSTDCSIPASTSLNTTTGEYIAPAGSAVEIDWSNVQGALQQITDVFPSPGYVLEDRFVNELNQNKVLFTMPASGTVYIGIRIYSGAMTGGTVTITNIATGESHTLLSGAVSSEPDTYAFPINN